MHLIWCEEQSGSPADIGDQLQDGPLAEGLAYWDSLPKMNGLPRRSDFSPLHIPRLLPDLFLIDVLPDNRFVYRLAGTRIEGLYRCSLRGTEPEQLFGERAELILRGYRLVRDTGQILHLRGLARPAGEREDAIRYDVVVMPFSADGTVVGQLLGFQSHTDLAV